MTQPQRSPVVVFDPGHGGAAPAGGSSPNHAAGESGLLEKDVVLDIARRAAALVGSRARVILTRDGDLNLPLVARAGVAGANRADIFVSIHMNSSYDRGVDGTGVWVARKASAESVELARAVESSVAAVTGRDLGLRQADLGVLLPERHDSGTAACLVEVAYLSNPAEAGRLGQDAYRQRLAEALADAVLHRLGAPAAASKELSLTSFLVDRLVRYFRNSDPARIPIDPGAGGLSIGQDALQIADIIISTTSHASSRLIRFGTGSQVSHAGLYIGGGQVVEAIGEGVVMRSLDESLADDSVAVAFRYPGITTTQQLQIRDYAGRQIGLSYNYLGIVRQALFQVEASHCDSLPGDLRAVCRNWVGKVVLGPDNTDTFFCSQLVLAAYADAGLPLTANPPTWSSPEDVVELSLSARLGYVGHLKAEIPTTQSLAAAIGGHGAESPAGLAMDAVTLGYGVPGGVITDGFYRDAAERTAVTGRSWGRRQHLGMDVSLSNASGGGADDPRRGLPVFAAVRRTIPISELNGVRAYSNGTSSSGIGLEASGDATLSNAIVLAQPWGTQDDNAYGGVVGLACRYTYTKSDGSNGTFTLYLEYLHLIAPPTYLPKDGSGNVISSDAWAATGKGSGFGPRITNGATLTADDLTAGAPILVGYLGATQFPHVHIQAAFGSGAQRYLRSPRIDPAVMLQSSLSVTQALAMPMTAALGFRGRPIYYNATDDFEPGQEGWPVSEHDLNSPERCVGLLRLHGPLVVRPAQGGIVVVIGVEDEGSDGGPGVWFVDADRGERRYESYRHFHDEVLGLGAGAAALQLV